MARDIHHLTPGRVSDEVDPERLDAAAVVKGQVSYGLRDEVMEQVTTGMQWAMTRGSEKVRQRASVLPSAQGKSHQLFEEAWKRVAEGRMFIFSPALLPQMEEDRVRVSPFGLVPKKHLGELTGKVRPINHGSWPPKRGLNHHTRTELEPA